MSHELRHKCLALTFPYVEKSIEVTEAFYDSSYLSPGEHHLLEPFLQEQIISSLDTPPYYALGGRLIQTLLKLSQTSIDLHVLGNLGEDTASDFYQASLEKKDLKNHLKHLCIPTSQVLSLTHPTLEMTQAVYLGASLDFDAAHLDPVHFEDLEMLLIDANSFLWGYLPLRAVQLARKSKAKVCLFLDSLSSYNLSLQMLKLLFSQPLDLLIATEQELSTFTRIFGETSEEFLKQRVFGALIEDQKAYHYYSKGVQKASFSKDELPKLKEKEASVVNHILNATRLSEPSQAAFIH